MSDRAVREAWDDARIDRALQKAVAVEPPASLRARVRERIAAEPAPSSRPYGFWPALAACAAAAVVAIAAIAGRGWNAREPAPPLLAARPPFTAALAYPQAVVPIAATPAGAAAIAARAGDGRRVDPGPAEPGLTQFAPADRAGFALLLAFSRSGRLLPPESLPPVSRDLDVVVPAIELSTIDIPALTVAGVGEGVSK